MIDSLPIDARGRANTAVGSVPAVRARVHATKGYYDMISLLEDFPRVGATFNIVPTLVVQIEAYISGAADMQAVPDNPSSPYSDKQCILVQHL